MVRILCSGCQKQDVMSWNFSIGVDQPRAHKFVKPLFGNNLVIGVCPPSNPALGLPFPALDF